MTEQRGRMIDASQRFYDRRYMNSLRQDSHDPIREAKEIEESFSRRLILISPAPSATKIDDDPVDELDNVIPFRPRRS